MPRARRRRTRAGDDRRGLTPRWPPGRFALAFGPFAGGREHEITGAILLGFSFGWALLALLSSRFSERPHRWALIPAVSQWTAPKRHSHALRARAQAG